jgi:hypothetical protein
MKAKKAKKIKRVTRSLLDKENQKIAETDAAEFAIGDVVWGPPGCNGLCVIRALHWGTLNSASGQGLVPSLCAVLEGLENQCTSTEHLSFCHKINKQETFKQAQEYYQRLCTVISIEPKQVIAPKNITQTMLKSWRRQQTKKVKR